jgi:spore germination cell wall hydrolase CwlJ-like protein
MEDTQMKNRIFLVVTVLATIVYLTLMTAKAMTVTPEVATVEAAVAPVVTEAPIEPLTAKTETQVNTSIETPVAGFSLLTDSDLASLYAEKDNDDDLMLLARLIESEAGNQSMAGKLAVASVVWNRTQYWNHKLFGTTIKEVILQDGSFDGVGTEAWDREPSKDSITAADKVLNHGYRTFGSDVVFYFNPKTATDKDFIEAVDVVMSIGDHDFGIEKKE